jgi:WD40 repeat protein
MRVLQGHRWAVRAVAFAPGDPSTLASAGDDHTVRLWNPGTGQNWSTLAGHPGGALALAFAPNGRLISGGRDGCLRLWDVAMGCQEDFFDLVGGAVVAVAVAPDGETVLAATRIPRPRADSAALVVWRPGGDLGAPEALPLPAPVLALAADPAGARLAVADERRVVELWGTAPYRRQGVLRVAQRVRGLAFGPGDGRPVLAVASGKLAELYDAATGERRAVCKGHRGEVRAVAFSPDGRSLATGSADKTVRLWEAATGRPVASWDWGIGPVYGVAFAPDGMTVAACGEKRDVVVWDVEA